MSWAEAWWTTRNIIKSIQRGVTASAATVNINEVNPLRTIVLSVSKGSSGYVAARGDAIGKLSGTARYASAERTAYYESDNGYNSYTLDLSGTHTLSGGSTDLTTKQFSAQLISSKQLKCDGPVEWQLIEFY